MCATPEGPDTSQNPVRDFEIPRFLARFRISQTSVLRRFVVLSVKLQAFTTYSRRFQAEN